MFVMEVECWWCGGQPDFYEGCTLCRGSGSITLRGIKRCKEEFCEEKVYLGEYCRLHESLEWDDEDEDIEDTWA